MFKSASVASRQHVDGETIQILSLIFSLQLHQEQMSEYSGHRLEDTEDGLRDLLY